MIEKFLDCAIIGGGPGGLTAGYYLKRFLRQTVIFDEGKSRASYIPVTYNIPGFSEGVSGKELLQRLTQQYQRYQGEIIHQTVTSIEILPDGFQIKYGDKSIQAKKVILATGSEDCYPTQQGIRACIDKGLVRQCPVCDAYEYQAKQIAILGEGDHALKEALFLARFSDKICLYLTGRSCTDELIAKAQAMGVKVLFDEVNRIEKNQDVIDLFTHNSCSTFDVIYSAYGTKVRSHLVLALNAQQKSGCLLVNSYNETSIPGLYAIGDVVSGLNQVVVAMGHAAIAATHIHNSLP
jgi:thioredoxin reductase (NADPH)